MESFFVLFVCTANMCRSPTAHGIFKKKIAEHGLAPSVRVDSAGTHDFCIGEPPDARSREHAARRGYDISDLRARQIQDVDFESADLILVMDLSNLALVQQRCPPAHQGKVRKLIEFCRAASSEIVPDPYRGEPRDFEHVLDLIEDACEGLIWHVREARGKAKGS